MPCLQSLTISTPWRKPAETTSSFGRQPISIVSSPSKTRRTRCSIRLVSSRPALTRNLHLPADEVGGDGERIAVDIGSSDRRRNVDQEVIDRIRPADKLRNLVEIE